MSIHSLLAENALSKLKKLPDNKINETNENGETALHVCARENILNATRVLIKKNIDINAVDNYGYTSLQIAVKYRNFKICELLLRKKLNANLDGVLTALVQQKTDDIPTIIKLVQICIDNGCDLLERDSEKNTPLHSAVFTGYIDIIQYLIENKANIDAINEKKNTPLHFAVINNREDIVSLLINSSARLSCINIDGKSPLDIAQENKLSKIVNRLTAFEKSHEKSFIITKKNISNPCNETRYGHQMIIRNNLLYIIGGCNNEDFSEAKTFYSSILVLDLSSNKITENKCNIDRFIAGFSINTIENTVFITGGVDSNGDKSKDLWTLDLSSFTWKQHLTIPKQIPLDFHDCTSSSRIEIFFLGKEHESFDCMYTYDIKDTSWKRITSANGKYPPYREKYTLSRLRTSIYLFGGLTLDGNSLNDLWMFDQRNQLWTEVIPLGNAPTPRYYHSSKFYNNILLICGGITTNNDDNTIYAFDVSNNSWEKYNVSNPIGKRIYSSFLVSDKNKFYIYGGNDSSDFYEGCKQTEVSNNIQNTLIVSKEQHNVDLGNVSSEKRSFSPSDRRPKKSSKSPRKFRTSTLRNSVRKRQDKVKDTISSGVTVSKTALTVKPLSKSPINSHPSMTQISSPPQTSIPEDISKTKRSLKQYLDHIELVEDYVATLSTDTLHIISIITSIQKGDGKTEDNLALLTGMCEELRAYCDSSNPPLLSDPAKYAKAQEKEQRAKRFEPKYFPYQYYQSINVAHEYKAYIPDNFESYSKQEKARHNIFNEIVQTETLYVNDLAIMIGIFMKPLQNEFNDVVNTYELASLFKNTEVLLDVNKKLLKLLQNEQIKPPKQQDIGSAFLECLSDIESKYITYSANQIAANETFVKLLASSPLFEQFCNVCCLLPECKNLRLDSYLIKPFQRVCRYSLLLKELDKQTPSSYPTAANIHKAKKAIDVIVGKANESKREADTLVQKLEIQNRFNIAYDDIELMQMHKLKYVNEGNFKYFIHGKKKSKLKNITLVLFKELLIFATTSNKKLVKMRTMKTDDILIYDKPETKQAKFAFTVVDISDNYKIDINASSLEDKKKWVDLINNQSTLDENNT